MKLSISQYSSKDSFSKGLTKPLQGRLGTNSLGKSVKNDSKIIQSKKRKQETKTEFTKPLHGNSLKLKEVPSKKVEKAFSLKDTNPLGVQLSETETPMKKSFPCLFVHSLEKKNEVLGTPLMNRFIRFLTKKGKKSKAYLVFSKTCTLLAQFEAEKMNNEKNYSGKDSTLKESLDFNQSLKSDFTLNNGSVLIEQAVSNVKPFVEVKKVRVAGTTYQVPAILEKDRQNNFALKWILQSAFERHKKNPSQPLEYSLAFEIYEASKKQGQARVKRNELHKLAETHRAFAHFRWW